MKAVEFEGRLAADDRIEIPPEVARQVPEDSRLRVILMWGEDDEDGWRKLAMERFTAAYAPEDSVYEKLVDEPPSR